MPPLPVPLPLVGSLASLLLTLLLDLLLPPMSLLLWLLTLLPGIDLEGMWPLKLEGRQPVLAAFAPVGSTASRATGYVSVIYGSNRTR